MKGVGLHLAWVKRGAAPFIASSCWICLFTNDHNLYSGSIYQLRCQMRLKNLDLKIPEIILRLKEAVCFLQAMIQNYHEPDIFLFNLHATVQTIRNITFVMQSELSKEVKFKEWYSDKQMEMRANVKLRMFVEERNILTKRKSHDRKSSVKAALLHNSSYRNHF